MWRNATLHRRHEESADGNRDHVRVQLLGVVPGKGRNPQAVAQVAAGKLAVANAAWWGFDSEDATSALQAAIDSKAKTVIVPYMGEPWIVRPIRFRGNLELVFEPGVLVLAKKGEFKGRWDCLLTATDQSDITIRGYGAILMRKRDYRNPPYPENEEWKHGIKLESCKRILIEGLRIESSGGDGIYIGMANRGMAGNEDIVIRDCVSDDNHRQGISVIDAKNLLVENCVFSGTEGTGPSAGVDFEPNDPEQLLVNCVFRNCLFENNAGHGMFVRAHDTVTADSPPISIRFENRISRMSVPGEGGDGGMVVRAPGDDGPRGLIEFINCTSENMGEVGANVYGHSTGNLKVRYVNCTVYDDRAGPSVQILSGGGDYRQDFIGTITVHNQYGARMVKPRRLSMRRLMLSTTPLSARGAGGRSGDTALTTALSGWNTPNGGTRRVSSSCSSNPCMR